MNKQIFITFILGFVSLFLSAQIIHVPADQSTIQAGINIAADGDTVLVAQGTYFENINYKGKAITVASNWIFESDSAHINNTIIDGSQPVHPDSASVVMFVSGEDTTSVLCGFTIQNGSGIFHSSLYSRSGGGIAALTSGAKIINNMIINNSLEFNSNAGGGGIGFVGSSLDLWVVIKDNIIKYNSVNDSLNAYGGGIYVSLCSIIENNIIEFNSCECEVGNSEGAGIEFQDIFSNELIIQLVDNKIRNNTASGVKVYGGGVTIFSGPYPKRNNANNYFQLENRSLQSSIDHIHTQPEISMRSGVSYILGNTISNNYLDAEEYWYGAGIYLKNPTIKFEIQSNEIFSNYGSENAYSFGGAIQIYESFDVELLIDGNIIKENSANIGGGLYINKSYNLEIVNNLFLENDGNIGGAIRFFHYLGDGSNDEHNMLYPMNKREDVSDQESEYHPVVANNTFVGNSASSSGGAILILYSPNHPVIFNSVFQGNISASGQDIALEDTIGEVPVFYNNINTQLISGNWYGEYNIYANPGFVDPSSDDYHLSKSSPCICMATGELQIDEMLYYCPAYDLDGNLRPSPQTGELLSPDIGACEEITIECIPDRIPEYSNSLLDFDIYPNPCEGAAHLRYQIRQRADAVPDPPEGGNGSRSASGKKHYVILDFFSIEGMLIKRLMNEEMGAGEYEIEVDLSDLPAGIYFCRLKTSQQEATRKIIKM